MKKILLVVMAFFLFFNNSHADSSMSRERIQQLVTEIYVATFERAPDYAGLKYWTDAVHAGTFTVEQVAQSFFDQPETKAKFKAGSSNTEFIETVYYNTLSRAPEAAGLAYWVGALDDGKVRRDQAIMAIINGAKAVTGSPADAAMLAKKTEIGLYFSNSEIGGLTTNENFMDWANNIIMFATSSDFDLEKAVEYVADFPSELESEIESYMTMISSVGDMSPMITEIGTLFETIMAGDTSIVTITPPLNNLNLSNLPPSITINANFGAGYTPEGSSAVFTGRAVITVTNIAFSDTGIGANVALAASNVQRDGQLILNGGMTLAINGQMAGENISLSGNANFSNLQSQDAQMNGGVSFRIPAISGEGQLLQPVLITFNQLATQDYLISGTTSLTQNNQDSIDALLNLSTNQGAIAGTIRLAGLLAAEQMIVSTPIGPVTAGDYRLNINNVSIDETCPETPSSGNIVVTRGGETSTLTFGNCTYTIQ